MGSNILNMYHQTPFSNIGHKLLKTRESLTSESSGNQNSPEYTQTQNDSDDGEYWSGDNNQRTWSENEQVNQLQPSFDVEFNPLEFIDDHNISIDQGSPVCLEQDLNITDESVDDHSLVEGADYDVIQVIAVDPNLLLEASSDEECGDTDGECGDSDGEYINPENDFRIADTHENLTLSKTHSHQAEINYDIPVVSNVDEYFIKNNEEKNVFEAKDELVVQDVDEYFIKNELQINPNVGNVENISQYNQGIDFRITESHTNIPSIAAQNIQPETVKKQTNYCDDDISDIEYIKEFLLNDLQFTKTKTASKTQNSISLPQTPMHNICMDIDTKTCFSFEDLELSDLSFEHVKDKSICSTKSNEIPRTLTDEDINSFLITNKNQNINDLNEYADDLTHLDMEIEKPLDSFIKCSDPSKFHNIISDRLSTSTPVPGSIIDFCIEKSAPIRHDSDFRITNPSPIRHVPEFCIVKPLPIGHKPDFCIDKSAAFTTPTDAAIDTLKLVRPQSVMGKHEPEYIKLEADVKCELSDFVDIESCGEGNVPVLKANSINSLLEQFEATEKLNTISQIASSEKNAKNSNKSRNSTLHENDLKSSKNTLSYSMISTCSKTTITKSPSPNAEHDYCVLKKRSNGTKMKGRQSLLKPDVLTSNNKILNSRHRSCKDKKIVYNLSSDDEADTKSKKKTNNRPIIKRDDIKSTKSKTKNSKLVNKSDPKIVNKKIMADASNDSSKVVKKSSVMMENANKDGDICSQNDCGSIKLTIRNKSEVIINKTDIKGKHNKSVQQKSCEIKKSCIDKVFKKSITVSNKQQKLDRIDNINIIAKDKPLIKNSKTVKKQSNSENFFTDLFSNINDVELPKKNKRNKKTKADETLKEQQPLNKKKKLNLQEYKMRQGVNSNSSSTQVSPEPIFPESPALQIEKNIIKVSPKTVPSSTILKTEITERQKTVPRSTILKTEITDRQKTVPSSTILKTEITDRQKTVPSSTILKTEITERQKPVPSSTIHKTEITEHQKTVPSSTILKTEITEHQKTGPSSTILKTEITEPPKVLFDPIREASRKIIMISKKQKLDALRKKEEEMLMKKIGKVETLELQPLISDSEMLKIIGMTLDVLPIPITSVRLSATKKYNEVVLVSIGTNTDENVFKSLSRIPERKRKSNLINDKKSNINFKIKKYDHLLKHNVFESDRKDVSGGTREAHQSNLEAKMDENRYKDIAATLKSVGKQVDTKISSNSLFASIQDVVMKKAPSVSSTESKDSFTKDLGSKHALLMKQDEIQTTRMKTTIIREYDTNLEHGEDKIILHLQKDTVKPEKKSVSCQTDDSEFYGGLVTPNSVEKADKLKRRRHDSDMSVSSGDDAELVKNEKNVPTSESKVAIIKPTTYSGCNNSGTLTRDVQPDEKSRPSDRQTKYRQSRSRSHSRGRRRSYSRNRSRSRDRYQSYRRVSPYRRKQHSRSPYRTYIRSPSPRRDYRYKTMHPRPRHIDNRRSRSPVKYLNGNKINNDKKSAVPLPTCMRNSTLSESSYSSSRSSSISKASASSSSSTKSSALHRLNEGYRNRPYKNYSSEDRENNTPVEERRIVFVGKLEKDLTKGQLRAQFTKFGPVTEVRLHSKEDGSRYGFVTYQRPRDAWSAVEAAGSFPQYDVGFGGRRAFCRQRYADLDGLEAKYTESAFHGAAAPPRRDDALSYEQLLLDVKNKLKNRKGALEDGGRGAQ